MVMVIGGGAVTPRVCVIFLIILRTEVNYYPYTTVATPQDIDQHTNAVN